MTVKNVYSWRHGETFYVQAVDDDDFSSSIFEYPVTAIDKLSKTEKEFCQEGYNLLPFSPPGWKPPELKI